MNFWASSETYQHAEADLERARRCVEPYLNEALKISSIADLELTIRYVPIVMPKEMHDRYKERSKARIKQKIYDCAPHLDYDVFVSRDFDSQIAEYLRGISLSVPHLGKFGLKAEQIEVFSSILAEALKVLPELRPNQTRH